jgi:hypothetical protein
MGVATTLDRPAPASAPAVELAADDRRLERAGLAIAAAIVLVHAAVRIDATALWLDESYSLGAANHLVDSLRDTSGTMGGYYVLLSAWSTVSTATWWLRSLSLVLALGTLGAVRPVARRIGGPRLVAVALPLLALGPAFAGKAIEARSYALVTLLTAGCWWVVVRALDAPDEATRLRRLLPLAPLALAGTSGHGLFLVQFAALWVVLALAGRPVRRAVELGLLALPAVVLVAVLRANGADSIGTTVRGGPGVLVASTFDVLLAPAVLPKLVLAQIVVIAAALAVRSVARRPPSAERAVAAIPASWAIVPCLALAAIWFDPVYNPRYLAPVAPGVALLVATALLAAGDAVRARAGGATRVVPVLVTVAVASLLALSLADRSPVIDEDWRGAAAHVAAEAATGDGIVFANLEPAEPVQQRPPFEAAWREVATDATPIAISPPRPLAEVRRVDRPVALDRLAAATDGVDRVWVVENQGSGVAQLDAVLGALEGPFVEVDRRTFDPAIVVVLLERR